MFQNRFNDINGGSGFSSCQIPAGSTHTYSFPVAVQDFGTYWWHSVSHAWEASQAQTAYAGILNPSILFSSSTRPCNTQTAFLVSSRYSHLEKALPEALLTTPSLQS